MARCLFAVPVVIAAAGALCALAVGALFVWGALDAIARVL